jgi:hypothetical protein
MVFTDILGNCPYPATVGILFFLWDAVITVEWLNIGVCFSGLEDSFNRFKHFTVRENFI